MNYTENGDVVFVSIVYLSIYSQNTCCLFWVRMQSWTISLPVCNLCICAAMQPCEFAYVLRLEPRHSLVAECIFAAATEAICSYILYYWFCGSSSIKWVHSKKSFVTIWRSPATKNKRVKPPLTPLLRKCEFSLLPHCVSNVDHSNTHSPQAAMVLPLFPYLSLAYNRCI